MDGWARLITAAGLAMDAFALSVCKGVTIRKLGWRHYLSVGLWFGGFQALTPLLGYLLGSRLAGVIAAWARWLALGLMGFLGMRMLLEARRGTEEGGESPSLAPSVMLPAALAVSMDALAAGISFSCLGMNIWQAIWVIGGLTALLSMAGLNMGHAFGLRYERKARLLGGWLLLIMAFRIWLEGPAAPFP